VGKLFKPLLPPSQETAEQWAEFEKLQAGGWWVGLFERPIFFAAFWIQTAWPLAAGWLVFKLAFYWQGANFMAFPETPPDKAQVAYLLAKRRLGAHYSATVLVGTAANIVLALVGVVVGRSIRLCA